MSFPPADPRHYPPPRPVAGGLYIVSTPIGNLRDITLRALDVLNAADVVLAEDTRVAGRLLSAYGLKKNLWRFDDHASEGRIPEVLTRLAAGAVVAQISDAGTPLISDPGYDLVRAARAAGHGVHPVPGASAVLAGLSVCGLPADRFGFSGFLPPRSGARRTRLVELKGLPGSQILFESGPRLRACLKDIYEVLGERQVSVCRELTKLYETVITGPVSELMVDERLDAPKGEIVVIIAGRQGPTTEQAEALEADLDKAIRNELAHMPPSEAARKLAARLGLPRRLVYQRAQALKDEV